MDKTKEINETEHEYLAVCRVLGDINDNWCIASSLEDAIAGAFYGDPNNHAWREICTGPKGTFKVFSKSYWVNGSEIEERWVGRRENDCLGSRRYG